MIRDLFWLYGFEDGDSWEWFGEYQYYARIHLSDYPEQKGLREEYFKKEEKRNRYFYKRFLERI